MSEVTVSIPQELLQTEVLRLMAEKAIGQSIVNAVAQKLGNYNVQEEVTRALKACMYDVARKHIEENPEIRAMMVAAVEKVVTKDLLEKTSAQIVAKLDRNW